MPNPEDPVIEDGVTKTNEPVSLTVAEPDAGTRRHEPHEPAPRRGCAHAGAGSPARGGSVRSHTSHTMSPSIITSTCHA